METFKVESCIRGYHVFRTVWSPTVGERLNCARETSNTRDPHAVAVMCCTGSHDPGQPASRGHGVQVFNLAFFSRPPNRQIKTPAKLTRATILHTHMHMLLHTHVALRLRTCVIMSGHACLCIQPFPQPAETTVTSGDCNTNVQTQSRTLYMYMYMLRANLKFSFVQTSDSTFAHAILGLPAQSQS